MSKDPAFLFYYQDFMWGTRFFNPYERGIYIELICEQADSKNGSISEEHMKNICKSYEKDSVNKVLTKFKKDENGYYNGVLREHLIKRKKYSESRSINRKGKKKKKNISKTYDNHMENVNVNENVNNNINVSFEKFWNLYNKKVGDKSRCETKWNKLKDKEREKVIETLPAWLKQIKEKQFQPYPETYLNQRRWNDEIIEVIEKWKIPHDWRKLSPIQFQELKKQARKHGYEFNNLAQEFKRI